MDLSYAPHHQALQEEVRQFLAENWDKSKVTKGGDKDEYIRSFRRLATEKGYLNRGIPKRFGGSEMPADLVAANIIREEFEAVRAPREVGGSGMAQLVPTLLDWGEEWQREMFIPRTVAGEIKWCQGYSEPGAGSDLASLRTRAELVGDEWVINGHKIWTTRAREADYMYVLCRSDPDVAKHQGLSYLIIDFRQPGVTVKPLRQISGSSEFAEVFLEDVRTPANWIIAKPGQGWEVARTNLKHERDSFGGSAGNSLELSDKLKKLARKKVSQGRPLIENPSIAQRLAAFEARALAHYAMNCFVSTVSAKGESPGPMTLMGKLFTSMVVQESAGLASDLIGDDLLRMPADLPFRGEGDEKWVRQIFGSLGISIAGGASNIQRNIIAERGLGLPRAEGN